MIIVIIIIMIMKREHYIPHISKQKGDIIPSVKINNKEDNDIIDTV